MISEGQLEAIHSDRNEMLWENHRYGSTYIVDRSPLLAMVDADKNTCGSPWVKSKQSRH